jgi:hypothetical protein
MITREFSALNYHSYPRANPRITSLRVNISMYCAVSTTFHLDASKHVWSPPPEKVLRKLRVACAPPGRTCACALRAPEISLKSRSRITILLRYHMTRPFCTILYCLVTNLALDSASRSGRTRRALMKCGTLALGRAASSIVNGNSGSLPL